MADSDHPYDALAAGIAAHVAVSVPGTGTYERAIADAVAYYLAYALTDPFPDPALARAFAEELAEALDAE